MFRTKYSRGIQITITAEDLAKGDGGIVNFETENELDRKIVSGIETYFDTILANAPDGSSIVTQAKAATIIVYLYDNNTCKFYGIPYNSFNTYLNAGIIRELKDFTITVNKCYIQLCDVAALAAGDTVYFNFLYDYDLDR